VFLSVASAQVQTSLDVLIGLRIPAALCGLILVIPQHILSSPEETVAVAALCRHGSRFGSMSRQNHMQTEEGVAWT